VAVEGTRIIFDYQIKNEMDVTIATASTTLVFVAKESMRPMKAPENIVKALENANK